MTAPHLPDDLEARLRAMFDAEAATVVAAPDLTGTSAPGNPPLRLVGRHHRRNVVLLAAAAVVAVVVGVALAGTGLSTDGTKAPVGTQPTITSSATVPVSTRASSPAPGSTCTAAMPTSWQRAIDAGRLTLDQQVNAPDGSGPDGYLLLAQQSMGQVGGETDAVHDEIALFDPAGHGTTLWTSPDPAHDTADADRDSALDARWAVFGVTASQNLGGPHEMIAYDRSGSSGPITFLQESQAVRTAGQLTTTEPIVVGDVAEWIEGDWSHPNGVEHIIGRNLVTGATVLNLPVRHASQLMRVGSATAWVVDAGTAQARLAMTPGRDLPAAVAQASVGASFFATDGQSVRWLTGTGANATLSTWNGSAPTVTAVNVAAPGGTVTVAGPFVFGGTWPDSTVEDTRTGAHLTLPAGLRVVLATAGDVVLTSTTAKFTTAYVSRVALASLPPVPC